MWTWIPAHILRRVGVTPKDIQRFRKLDGRVAQRPYADARVACLDRDCPTLVVFAAEGDPNTLGEHALACMGLEVDPEKRSLRDGGPILALATIA